MNDIHARLAKLESRHKVATDNRLVFFTNMLKSSGNHSAASDAIRASKVYNNCCAFCGTSENVNLAHIVPSNSAVNYSAFSVSNGYVSNLDVTSPRNFLPLCGSNGQKDSCCDEFEKFRITLLYQPFRQVYTIFCLDLKHSPKAHLHLKDIAVDNNFPPYRRLLAWRARKCLLEHQSDMPDLGEALFELAKISDASRSVAGADDCADDDENEEGTSDWSGEGEVEGEAAGVVEGAAAGEVEGDCIAK